MLAIKIFVFMLAIAVWLIASWGFFEAHIGDADGGPYTGFDGRWFAVGGFVVMVATGFWIGRG